MTAPLKADYLVRIGRREVSPRSPASLASVVVEATKTGAALAELRFGDAFGRDAALDDRVTVELGWSGARKLVFTGAVYGIEPALPGIALRAYGEEMKLMRTGRISAVFENQTHGDIVKALARQAGVSPGSIEDGYRMPRRYAHNETPYAVCRVLATIVGFDLYATAEGKLTFARFARRAADHVLRSGIDVLSAALRSGAPLAGVTVVPESPASSAGDETAAWLVKDPAAHAATEGEEGVLTVSAPSLRTREAAQLAAAALVRAAERAASRGTLSIVGNAAVKLGQAVELKEFDQRVDGLYEVLALRHALGRDRGLSTALDVARIAA
jgi:phage protein D